MKNFKNIFMESIQKPKEGIDKLYKDAIKEFSKNYKKIWRKRNDPIADVCRYVSIGIANILEKKNIKCIIKIGLFKPDLEIDHKKILYNLWAQGVKSNTKPSKAWLSHAWLEINKKIYDPTSGQFKKWMQNPKEAPNKKNYKNITILTKPYNLKPEDWKL